MTLPITYVTTVDAVKGVIIKRIRKSKHISQHELAEAFEISAHTLSNIECGKIAATQEIITKLILGTGLTSPLVIDQLTFDIAVAEATEALTKRDVLVVNCYASDIHRMKDSGHAVALENLATIEFVVDSLYIYGIPSPR